VGLEEDAEIVYSALSGSRDFLRRNIMQDDDKYKVSIKWLSAVTGLTPKRVGRSMSYLHKIGKIEIIERRRYGCKRGHRSVYIFKFT